MHTPVTSPIGEIEHCSGITRLPLFQPASYTMIHRERVGASAGHCSGGVRSRDPARGARAEGASASRCSLAFSLFARLSLGDLGGTISASRPIVFSSLSQAVYRKSPSMTYYIIQVFDIAFFVSYKFRPALSNTGNENTNGRLVLGACIQPRIVQVQTVLRQRPRHR